MTDPIRVIVCRVGDAPVVETIANDLKSWQGVVGGFIENVALSPGIALICNEDGRPGELPPNRAVTGLDYIHGDFFILAVDNVGEGRDLTDAEVEALMASATSWATLWPAPGSN